MWPFSIKKKQNRSCELDTEREHPLCRQIIERKDIKKLHKNDTTLRLWLPEEGKLALDEVVISHKTLGSRYLREFFVVYLYGEHELLRMRSQKTGLYYIAPPPPPRHEEQSNGGIRFSFRPTIAVVPGIGKNIVPVKLHIPEKIKLDLQSLADKADITLSSYVRELLMSHLLGHTFWRDRLRSWTLQEEETAKQWEDGTMREGLVAFVSEEDPQAIPGNAMAVQLLDDDYLSQIFDLSENT